MLREGRRDLRSGEDVGLSFVFVVEEVVVSGKKSLKFKVRTAK